MTANNIQKTIETIDKALKVLQAIDDGAKDNPPQSKAAEDYALHGWRVGVAALFFEQSKTLLTLATHPDGIEFVDDAHKVDLFKLSVAVTRGASLLPDQIQHLTAGIDTSHVATDALNDLDEDIPSFLRSTAHSVVETITRDPKVITAREQISNEINSKLNEWLPKPPLVSTAVLVDIIPPPYFWITHARPD